MIYKKNELGQVVDKWGDELNPHALDLGIIGFSRKCREHYAINEGESINHLKDFYDDFKHMPPTTFEAYIKEIEGY